MLIEEQKKFQEKQLQAQKDAFVAQEEKKKEEQNAAINILDIKADTKATTLDDL